MRLGYNTNGFAHHDLIDAIEVLAQIGYESVAITLDHHSLNPYTTNLSDELKRVAACLRRLNMRSVIETGARFLLDPHTKHEPTLLTSGTGQMERLDFLQCAIRIAAELESDCVSLWSGILRDDISDEDAFDRLSCALGPVLQLATHMGVTIGFEPEPGMLIDTMQRYEELFRRLNSHAFQLTLDVGHLHCLGETPIDQQIFDWREQIVNVHIEDMRTGVHDHLMFGEGEMNFAPILRAFRDIDYQGGLHVELSRHSHDAVNTARRAFEFLRSVEESL
jgi:L-ribulose-5-phosphate 3-epimerase